MDNKLLLEDIKKIKVSISKEADSFDFLKNYLIDKGIIDKSEFEFDYHNHMNSLYTISGEVLIEEYNITIGDNQ